jgi:hypothetical protein
MAGSDRQDVSPGEVPPVSGPQNYATAVDYALQAYDAERAGRYEHAAVLAAIGQLHATLAVAAATALHEEYADIRGWRAVTGQEGR